jgi:nucleotide-binding universal stress UspA family protein
MTPDQPTPVFPGLDADGAHLKPAASAEGRVIVGIDGSPESHAALRWALRYARRTGSPVEAVAAWQVPLPVSGTPAEVAPSASRAVVTVSADDVEAVAHRWLNEAAAGADVGPESGVRLLAVQGDPVDVLLGRADRAALIVLGNKGHSAIAAAVLGSVAQRCVHHAQCPVVLVPPVAG